MSEPAALVHARGLTKSYGKGEEQVHAVRGIDLDVRAGESFGFLGPNGAGKSTTMRMVAAVSPPTGGELRILGMDPLVDGPSIRANLGVCPQEDTLDPELSTRENLIVYGRYFGMPRARCRARAEELLGFAQLSEKADAKVESLSGGMKRRLTIARSLINNPTLLLLDEPTTGLDPQARHLVWDRLFRLKQSGVTLVLTTHYMDEAEQLCDRLVVIDGGVIVAQGSPRELIAEYSSREVAEVRFDAEQVGGGSPDDAAGHEAVLAKYESELADLGERVEALPDRLLIYTGDGEQALETMHGRGLRPVSTLVRRSTLEDVFLRLTGRSLVD